MTDFVVFMVMARFRAQIPGIAPRKVAMLSKRHAEILRILEAEDSVSVSVLADRLGVSHETVRRDLRPLTENGSVLKTHGAVGLAGRVGEAPFQRRMRENAGAKMAIARHVAGLVRDGETLMLDTGTTTSFIARALTGHRRLTVITNSTDAARILSAAGAGRIFLTGGELRADSGAMLGPIAIGGARQFSAGLAVISAGAIEPDAVMDYDPDEADFARALLDGAERRVVATDFSKFGRRGLVRVCDLDGIDVLVTEAPPPDPIARRLGGRLAVAKP